MQTELAQCLLDSDEPWTRYRTFVDLLDCSEDDADVRAARKAMLAHPQVKILFAEVAAWGEQPVARHNDAGHAIHKLSTLADFGVRSGDRGMKSILTAVMAHQSSEGAFQSLVNVSRSFGGTGKDTWAWMQCDAPVLVSLLLAMGLGHNARVKQAVQHLTKVVDENGWRCVVASELGKFRGPGRKADPCPIANVHALKALAQSPDLADCPATRTGTEMLLAHWQNQKTTKYYLFGVGTDFRKLKYPFVWYDILHVVDVLSRFPFVHGDKRFQQMVKAITVQADKQGRDTAASMYQSWKGWSFADKKNPSPWLTFLVLRILKRIHQAGV